MSVADKVQFPMDCEEKDCHSCIYLEYIEGGNKTDYCTEKEKFIDYKKICKKYEVRE